LLLEKTADIFAFANSFSSNDDQFHGGMINTMGALLCNAFTEKADITSLPPVSDETAEYG
jgi:hypothetical protein